MTDINRDASRYGAFWPGNRATAASAVGLIFGPSTMLVFTFGVFVAPLSASFGWSRPAIAFGSTIIALMTMLVSPIQGYLIDRYGARPVVLTSVPLFAAGLFAMPFLPNDIRAFYAACTLLPVLGLGLWASSYLRVVSTWYDRRLGLAIGIANGGIGLGTAIVPLIATTLMQDGNWGRAYVGLGLLALLVTWPINYFFLREAPRARLASAAGRSSAGSTDTQEMAFGDAIRTGAFRILLVAFLMLGFISVGLIVNQVPLLIDGGATPARAAAAQATFGIAILISRFLCGVLLDRMPAPLLMALVCLGGAAGCLLYLGGATDAALIVSPILIGGVIGAEFDILSYIIKKYFGIVSFGRIYGVIFAVFQFGAAIGATVLPFSLARTGGYGPGLATYAAALLIAATCFVILRPARFAGTAPAMLAPNA